MKGGHLLTVADLILLLLLVCQVNSSREVNPNGGHYCGPHKLCKCDKDYSSMTCENRHLKTFVVNRAQNWSLVENLDLRKNLFQTMPADLRMFTNLKRLRMTHNKITKLEEDSFTGLENLEQLDLSYMELSFNTKSIHNQTFKRLTKLQDLRIKQINPAVGSGEEDYSFLLPVKNILQTLFVVGTPDLSQIFNEEFPRLNYLSLGGINCNLSGFPYGGFTSLHKSPLNKLSMRACNMKTIPTKFLKRLAKSLARLDISCNPLHEALENITQSLIEGSLKVLVADYINRRREPCAWNVTSEFILPSLDTISLHANHINYFTLKDSNTVKNLKFLDISYNLFLGAGLNIFTTKCEYLFSCNQTTALHQLELIGVSGITESVLPCEQAPSTCKRESYLLDPIYPLKYQEISHPEYLDALILNDWFKEIKETAQADMRTFINNRRNVSSLPSWSIMRILLESIGKYPDADAIIDNVINITQEASSKIEVLENLAKYLCRNQSVEQVYKDTTRTWVRLSIAHYTTWSDKAIDKTISYICKRSDWQYGVNFLTKERFHWLLTNLTTLNALGNDLKTLAKPNIFCNDAVYFLNNLRTIDLSYSNVPYIACSNISGLDTLSALKCVKCNNYGWNFTAADFPSLHYFYWAFNNIGHLIRAGNLFRGFFQLGVINLQYQHDAIKYFERCDTFSDQKYLRHLKLDGNGIETWNISLQNHNYIEFLSLRRNKIAYMEKKFQLDLDQTYKNRKQKFSVFLAENPINCSCSPKNQEFVKWLIFADVIADRAQLTCGSGDEKHLSNTLEECRKRNAAWSISTVIVVCTSSAVALLGIFAVSLVIRRRIRWKRVAGYEQLPDERLPTAFISFPQSMTDEVKALKDMIQDQLILLSSVWDFLDGDTISNNLSAIVAETKKFILVITPDYFNEEGTSKEFHLMQNAGLLQREKVLLIFTSGSVVVNKLPGVLQEMYNAGEFLIWPLGVCAGIEFKQMAEKIIEKLSE